MINTIKLHINSVNLVNLIRDKATETSLHSSPCQPYLKIVTNRLNTYQFEQSQNDVEVLRNQYLKVHLTIIEIVIDVVLGLLEW